MLKRQQKAAAATPEALAALAPKELAKYPLIVEFLGCAVWEEDGTERTTGTIQLFTDGGMWKAMLNDRAQSLVAFVTVLPGESLLAVLEKALAATGTDWRTARKFQAKK